MEWRWLLRGIGVAWLATGSVCARENYQLELDIVPKVCVIGRSNDYCHEAVVVEWRSRAPLNVCLAVDVDHNFAFCWSDVKEGKFEWEQKTQQDITFLMQSPNGQHTYGSASLSVVKTQNRQTRRRRRHAWSLF